MGEIFFAFTVVAAKTYLWLATFVFVAGFSIIEKGLEVRVDPAPGRVAGLNWDFAGALTTKTFEHIACTLWLTPVSNGWESIQLQQTRESKHLVVEQWVRRSMWAASYYQEYFLAQQEFCIKIGMRSGY